MVKGAQQATLLDNFDEHENETMEGVKGSVTCLLGNTASSPTNLRKLVLEEIVFPGYISLNDYPPLF